MGWSAIEGSSHTLNFNKAIYARIMVDVDCATTLPKKLLITIKNININFFISVAYKSIQKFCNLCCVLVHDEKVYRRRTNEAVSNDKNQVGDYDC